MVAGLLGQPDRVPPPVPRVTGIDTSRFLRPPPQDPRSEQWATFVAQACRYGMETWYADRGYDRLAGFIVPRSRRNVEVRPLGAYAETCAVALATGAYADTFFPGGEPAAGDTAAAVATPDDVLRRTIRLIVGVARSNQANGGLWGGSSPVPHGTDSTNLAAPVMLAAWLLWPHLAPAETDLVVAMADYEAERLMAVPIRYYRDREGKILTPGDSGSEELVWNATFLSLMVNMFGDDPRREAWERRLVASTLAAWARPADLDRPDPFHGRPLAEWLHGSNLNADGTLANGGIEVNPFYMSAIANSVFQAAAFALGGRPTPASATFNVAAVHDALATRRFDVKNGFKSPGGTMYVDGRPDLYYPRGNRKQTNVYGAFAFVDWTAARFTEGETAVRADRWEGIHLGGAVAMQRRFADGRSNLTEAEGGAEEEFWVAYWAARAYLMRWLDHQVGFEFHNLPYE